MVLDGGGRRGLAVLLRLVGEAEVQRGRRQQADAGVAVFLVVPREKPPAEGAPILDGAETIREFGRYFMVRN